MDSAPKGAEFLIWVREEKNATEITEKEEI